MKHSVLAARQSLHPLSRWLSHLFTAFIGSLQFFTAQYALGSPAVLPSGQIVLQDGKLTARLSATPLKKVLEDISKLSGARLRWLGGVAEERPVSVGVTALPLAEALRQILGESNFLLFYASGGEDTRLTQIWISSKKTGDGHSGLTPRLAEHAPPLSTFDSQSEHTEERQAALDTVSLDTLIQTAVSTQAPAVRVEAIAQLGEYASADQRAADILSHLAANEREPQIQAAASEVLAGIAAMAE